MEADYDSVLNSLLERDRQDTTRKTSPLVKTDDAIVIDNSNLSRGEQLELALKYINERLKNLDNAKN